MQKLIVQHLEGSYPVYIGKSLLNNKLLFLPHISGKQIMLVTNTFVAPLYLDSVREHFNGLQCNQIILDDGESQKNFENFIKILDNLVVCGHHRDTTIIALGGGVINDISGFVAACYHRGVAFISVPTTLLAQIDAAIGGKTAINHPRGKNLIGAFFQPKAVVIDIDTLVTLTDRHYRAGIAEIIKVALINDLDFFIYLERNLSALLARDEKTLITVIERACQIKINIVSADAKELGIRAILNFGHTFGHAIESYFQYEQWLHGEAVALGMILAANLSRQISGLSEQEYLRIFNLIEKAGLPTQLPQQIIPEQLLTFMLTDKKISQNQLRLVLLPNIGHALLTTVDRQIVLQAMG